MMYGKYLHLRVYGKDWREMRLLTRVFGGNYHDHMAAKMPVYHCWQITAMKDLQYVLKVLQDGNVELPARLEALRSYILRKSSSLTGLSGTELEPDGLNLIPEEVSDDGEE